MTVRRRTRQVDLNPPSLRGLAIAEAVALADHPISLDDIAVATGLPKSTLHRFISAMVEARVLLREPHGKFFSAGERLSAMAFGIIGHSGLQSERRSILRSLVDQIGETCNFTTLDAHDVVYVDRIEAAWPLRVHLQAGSRVPIHCTSSGKLFLAHMPARQRRRLLYDVPIQRYTAKTITDPVRLEAELNRIRKTRISTDDEGYLAGLISVAVPVQGRDRKVIGTVAVHAPTARMSLKQALGHVALLRNAASELGSIYRRFA